MPTPDTYYEKVDSRVAGHQEDLAALKALRILIDGSPTKDGILLQIFTDTVIGPGVLRDHPAQGQRGLW
jgi:4-hydroxyphenylpyruvate dioxygenase